MFENLRASILTATDMSEEDFTIGTNLLVPKKLRKRQYLLQAGDVCRWVAFVSGGCLRQYSLDDDGNEHIQAFAIEGEWIADTASYHSHEPATSNIDALEDSELLLIDLATQEKLAVTVPPWGLFFKRELENAYTGALVRVSELASLTAEERYIRFLKKYPGLFQRIPLHQIASYLGMTPQSLSRIRRELADRK
ncbi:MAG TPA: Crp/Fnr family transcriptional regulator [Bacteroidota bacterium]|nr:Crp/Fnr family transcriptional regulator [Bacteroidota bacterium]